MFGFTWKKFNLSLLYKAKMDYRKVSFWRKYGWCLHGRDAMIMKLEICRIYCVLWLGERFFLKLRQHNHWIRDFPLETCHPLIRLLILDPFSYWFQIFRSHLSASVNLVMIQWNHFWNLITKIRFQHTQIKSFFCCMQHGISTLLKYFEEKPNIVWLFGE